MDNYLLLKPIPEIEELSKQLGFTKTLFLERDLMLISGSLAEMINKAKEAKRKKLLAVCEVEDEKKIRLVLEKVPVDIIMGMEKIFRKDSVHFPKSGLDQVLCKIAAEQGKAFGFSFSEILKAKDRPTLLRRVMFNLKLCQKYNVKVVFSNFSLDKWEMRSAKDLEAFQRILR